MLFNSLSFLVFFPTVTLVYFTLRGEHVRRTFLLIASYVFYMGWDARFGLLILYVTAVTYVSSCKICFSGSHKKMVLLIGTVMTLAPLFYFKYFAFILELLTMGFRFAHTEITLPAFSVILPVGISFFTFQALSYLIDVYRGEIQAERDFILYALFISFFPQLVAGPIERSRNLLHQLAHPARFDFDRAYEGVLLMLWGFFLKIVLADRIAIFVDAVYMNYGALTGWYLFIATVLFAVQIYCDFAGYSVIAIGCAKVLGVSLMDNFEAPYLATSVASFWRRWHISLTSWLRDYVYFPLGGSRRGKRRKALNQMTVFLISGLWHGASLSFVVWGALNGLYQVIGEALLPVRERVIRALKLNPDSNCHQLFRMFITFLLVDFSWVFFRAPSLSHAIEIIRCMFRMQNPWILWDQSLYTLGLSRPDFCLILLSIGTLLIADWKKMQGVCIRRWVMAQDAWAQVLLVAAACCFLLLFGLWGPSYKANNFIYFQF